jgi:uncharacterized protein (DUF1330 family)
MYSVAGRNFASAHSRGLNMRTQYIVTLALLIGVGLGAVVVQGLHAQTKPPAYVIAEIDVADQDGYAREYLSRSRKPINEEGGGVFLSRGSKSISIRGEPPKRIVLFRFENLDRAQAAFASPGYSEAYSFGEKYAKFRIYAVEGVPPK